MLAFDEGVRYLVFPMAAEDRGELKFMGFLSDEDMAQQKTPAAVSDKLNGKRLSVLGDSLSSARDYCPDGNYGFYPKADADVTDLWWYRIAEDFQMDVCYINAYAGSGVTNRLGRAETAAGAGRRGRNLSSNGQDPDVIIVWIGGNDVLQGVSLKDTEKAYRMMLDDIKECYPSADVYLTTYYYSGN